MDGKQQLKSYKHGADLLRQLESECSYKGARPVPFTSEPEFGDLLKEVNSKCDDDYNLTIPFLACDRNPTIKG